MNLGVNFLRVLSNAERYVSEGHTNTNVKIKRGNKRKTGPYFYLYFALIVMYSFINLINKYSTEQ
jgi:hypothetical protein